MIILSVISCAIIGVPSVVVFLNNRKLKALVTKKELQTVKTQASLRQAQVAEQSYIPYSEVIGSLQDQKGRNLDLDRNIQTLQSKLAIVITDKEFLAVNQQIQTLQDQITESKKKEITLFQKAKPIMDRIETERRRQAEIERKAQQKRDEEALIARKKRDDEEEEVRRERRRRDDEASAAAAASSYSSSSSSSDSGSSWSGGGGDSSGGGSSDSW